MLYLLACVDSLKNNPVDSGTSPGDTGAGMIANEWGFAIHAPESRTVTCPSTSEEYADAHWLCTFDNDRDEGMVYLEATVTGCMEINAQNYPVYETIGELWIGGSVRPLDAASYGYNPNPVWDTASFTVGTDVYVYSHSTATPDYEACDVMDCMNITNTSYDILIEGCTCERLYPIVCVPVEADGTWEPLVDDYQICPDDPECSP